jgi:hypothetical protein
MGWVLSVDQVQPQQAPGSVVVRVVKRPPPAVPQVNLYRGQLNPHGTSGSLGVTIRWATAAEPRRAQALRLAARATPDGAAIRSLSDHFAIHSLAPAHMPRDQAAALCTLWCRRRWSINDGAFRNSETSDWACAAALFYNRVLSSAEYLAVEWWLNKVGHCCAHASALTEPPVCVSNGSAQPLPASRQTVRRDAAPCVHAPLKNCCRC